MDHCDLCQRFNIRELLLQSVAQRPEATRNTSRTYVDANDYRTFQGQIYIGCSSWTSSRQGYPYVTLTQRSSTGAGRTLCSFEAFTDRGPNIRPSLLYYIHSITCDR